MASKKEQQVIYARKNPYTFGQILSGTGENKIMNPERVVQQSDNLFSNLSLDFNQDSLESMVEQMQLLQLDQFNEEQNIQ